MVRLVNAFAIFTSPPLRNQGSTGAADLRGWRRCPMAGDGAPSGAETQAQSAKRPSGRTTMAGDGGHLGVVAHQSDRGLLEVDQLDARHRPQNVLGGLDHALDAG